ncbi:Smn1p [Sporobolomyces koalae]|uniref:Smn1p n=1 Tax=Sporobolomyces koalae TaxID=500713 RepID=UPI00317EF0B5
MLLSGSRDDDISTVEIEQEQPSKRRRVDSSPACENIFGDNGQPDRSESESEEEDAENKHDLLVSREKEARPKRNPEGYTTEGRRDYVVLDNSLAKSKRFAKKVRPPRMFRGLVQRKLTLPHYPALEKAPHVGSAFQEVRKENYVLNGLDEYLPGARFDSAQAVATADPNSSTAVSPYGMQVWQGLVLALGKEEGRGAVPSGLAAAAVDLLSNLAHRAGGGAEVSSGSELQEAWRLAKAQATTLVNETLPQGSETRKYAIDAIEHQTIEWSGNLFDVTSHVSNYAPLASLDRADHAEGIDADSTFTGRLMREKGSHVYDTLLIDANGFAADPYSLNILTSALVRTTPVEAIDREDGSGVELRGLCTRAFWDTAGILVKTRARCGTVDILVGPQAHSLGLTAAEANSKESDYNFVKVRIPLVLPGFENEHGAYREAVTDLDADASEAALHVLRTGRELDTVQRSNFAESAIPRGQLLAYHPRNALGLAIQANSLRRDEKEFQASLDPARVPRGGFRCESLPIWLQQSLQKRLGTAVSADCDFVEFHNLPSELQDHYAEAAVKSPTSSTAKARLDGVSPLEACSSLVHLKANATKRKQVFDDGKGGTMNGLEAGARKARATLRTMQLDDGQGGTMNGLEASAKKAHATLGKMQLDDGQGGTMNGLEASARKARATLGKMQLDDGQGGTMNGLEAKAKKALATRLANGTFIDDWSGFVGFIWRNALWQWTKRPAPGKSCAGITVDVPSIRRRLLEDNNHDFSVHLRRDDRNLKISLVRNLRKFPEGGPAAWRKEIGAQKEMPVEEEEEEETLSHYPAPDEALASPSNTNPPMTELLEASRILDAPAIASSDAPAATSALQIPFRAASTSGSVEADQQPDSSSPVDWPYRELPWGEVNVLSTTDTHGWLLGHQRNEPSFSGDWGDLYSFVSSLKEEARKRGVDLLLVDSGDRVDGNGLVDAEPSANPKGYTALSLFAQMPYDLVTTGNHELYRYPVAKYAREVLAAKFGEKWVVSNVNITLADERTGQETETLLGNRFRKFETTMGRKVTAFGPLFDFKAHAPGIKVQKPSEMVKDYWFREAIRERPDFFLFAGHMSVRIEPDSEWRAIIAAIRAVHPTVPVLVFGGHHHIRDCVQEDKYSMSLAAGRYMETIGFASVSGLNDTSKRPRFARRYIDQNRNSYAYHAGKRDFDTERGQAITAELVATAKRFNLTDQYGVAPQDYFLHRYPATSQHSIFHLLTTEILPTLIRRSDRPHPPFSVLNTGSVRFDLFQGPFTRNDQWILLPFPNNFLYIPSVPIRLASKLIPYMNLVGEHGLLPTQRLFWNESETLVHADRLELEPEQLIAAEAVHLEHARRKHLLRTSEQPVALRGRWKMNPLSEGYVTLDSCGPDDLGDDTLHTPYKTSRQPIFVSTELPRTVDGQGSVDVVFFDFIQPDILSALNYLDDDKRWETKDVSKYMEDLTANTLLETWAKKAWN